MYQNISHISIGIFAFVVGDNVILLSFHATFNENIIY